MSGNADLVFFENSVGNDDRGLGIPNGDYAKLDNNSDVYILDLTDTIPIGFELLIYHASDNDDTTQGTVEGSEDGINFFDATVFSSSTNKGDGQDTLSFRPLNSGVRYLRFTHQANKIMIDAISYSDHFGPCEPIPNAPPLATDDFESTAVGVPITIQIQNNDFDLEGSVLTTTLDPTNPAGPSNNITIVGNDILFTPSATFTGVDSFSYIICDDLSACDTALVVVDIENSAPTAVDDLVATPFETSILIPVQDNDSDLENGILTTIFNGVIPPQNGGVVVLSDSILYIPDASFTGLDTFSYILCDDETPALCDTAMVIVTVVNQPPVAIDDMATTETEVPLTMSILDNDSDLENSNLNITLLGGITNGNVILNFDNTVTYISDPLFIGVEMFDYEICDEDNPIQCDTATVTITVDPFLNSPPIGVNDYDTTNLNQVYYLNVKSNDIEPDADTKIISLDPGILQPTNGVLSIESNGLIEYLPNNTFAGDDSFEYIVCDDRTPKLCDTATVFIYVNNRPPIAIIDYAATGMNLTSSVDVLANDFDPDLGVIFLVGSGIDSNNGLTNQGGAVVVNDNGTPSDPTDDLINYTPPNNYIGQDTFRYAVCDDAVISLCDTGLVIMTITPPIDLELSKTVTPATCANVGDTVVFSVTITNVGAGDGTVIQVEDKLPAGLAYISDNQSGFYDYNSGIWFVGDLTNSGGTKTLLIEAEVTSLTGITNVAQVSSSTQVDVDSNPNNDDGDQSEDDEASARPQTVPLVPVTIFRSGGDLF